MRHAKREPDGAKPEERSRQILNPHPALSQKERVISPLLIFVTATAVICQVSRKPHFLRLRAGAGLRFPEARYN